MKEKLSVSIDEQETTICIDPKTKRASVYSCVPYMVKKLIKLSEEDEVILTKDDSFGVEISVPAKWIKISKPRKVFYTEEQKKELVDRMRRARKFKKET